MMKAYPEYKHSKINWAGDIPSHWNETKLKFVCDCLDSLRVPLNGEERSERSGDIPYWGANGIVDYINDFIFDEPLVLVGEDGAPFFDKKKDVAFFIEGKNWVNNHAHILRTKKDKIHEIFLKHLLNTVSYELYINGSTRDKLTQFQLNNISIPIPELNEQNLIVRALGNELKRLDDLIKEKQSFIKLLQEKRQALISHVVTKGLDDNVKMKPSGVEWIGDIPEHWEVKPIKYLGVLGPSKSELSHDFLSRQCSFVPMEKLKTDTILLDEERVVQDVVDGYTYFANGDILFAKVTPCFENKNMCIADGLTNGIGFGSSEINVFRTNKSNNTKFVYYLFQEEYFMQFAKSNMTGTGGLKRVPSDVVLDYKVAVPPLKEQIEIAEEISNRFARLALLIEETKNSIELLKEHRTALISAAVTGKIDVREAV